MGRTGAEAIDGTLVQLTAAYHAAPAALLAASAAFFLLAPGTPDRALQRWLLAAVLICGAAFEVGVVRALTLDPGRATEAGDRWVSDVRHLQALLSAALLAVYPTRPAWRRLEGLAALAGIGLLVFGWAAYLGAKPAIFAADPSRLGAPYSLLGRLAEREGMDLAMLLLVSSAYARTRALAGDERRGAWVVIAMFAGGAATVGYIAVLFAAGLVTGTPFVPSAFAGVAGDCCRLLAVPYALLWFVGFPLLVAWRWRAGDRIPAAFVAYGAATGPFLILFPVDLWPAGFILQALLPLYAVVRYRALGAAEAPRWARPLLPASVFLLVFLIVSAPVLLAAGTSPLGLVLAVLLGLALGGLAAMAVLPRTGPWSLAWSASEPPDATARRLGAYRAALQAEVDAGAAQGALASKLRPLRMELGVSEQEHNALLFGLGPRAPAGRGLEIGASFLGRYRVECELGKGGSGTTFLCRDEVVGRPVVVKAVKALGQGDEAIRTVVREARALGGVEHPNVVRLHDVQQVGDDAYLIMEHVKSGSLKERLAAGPLSRDAFLGLARDVLQGLEAVHAAGVVHRDVKPSNILFDSDGRAKLADFGVAQLPGLETTVGGRDGGPGTVQYMSPEQAKGKLVTPQSDLFSAAATLYEALTGEPYLGPRARESVAELRIRAADPGSFRRPLRGNAALKAWFARALEPDPRRRFASARAMREALEQARMAPSSATAGDEPPAPATAS
jgi:hypothetical protein